jgi:hypothetical protein
MIHTIRIPYLATFEHTSTKTASTSSERLTTSSPTDTDRSLGKSERFQSTLGLGVDDPLRDKKGRFWHPNRRELEPDSSVVTTG